MNIFYFFNFSCRFRSLGPIRIGSLNMHWLHCFSYTILYPFSQLWRDPADRAQWKPCVSFLRIISLNIINNKNVSFLIIIYLFPSCEGVMRTVSSGGPAEGRCWATRRRGRFLLVHECLRAILLRGRGIRLGVLSLPPVQVRTRKRQYDNNKPIFITFC